MIKKLEFIIDWAMRLDWALSLLNLAGVISMIYIQYLGIFMFTCSFLISVAKTKVVRNWVNKQVNETYPSLKEMAVILANQNKVTDEQLYSVPSFTNNMSKNWAEIFIENKSISTDNHSLDTRTELFITYILNFCKKHNIPLEGKKLPSSLLTNIPIEEAKNFNHDYSTLFSEIALNHPLYQDIRIEKKRFLKALNS